MLPQESRDHLILYAEVLGGVAVPVYTFMAWMLRNRCREIDSIQRSLQNFRMKDTNCYDPNDRKLVEARIEQVWGKTEDFDEFVQQKLSREMATTVGAADMPPMWLDLVLCMVWMVSAAQPGLERVATSFCPPPSALFPSALFLLPFFLLPASLHTPARTEHASLLTPPPTLLTPPPPLLTPPPPLLTDVPSRLVFAAAVHLPRPRADVQRAALLALLLDDRDADPDHLAVPHHVLVLVCV